MDLDKYIKRIAYREARVAEVEFDRSLEDRPLWEMLAGVSPELALRWVGRFSALESLAAQWALAMVIESAFVVKVPRRGAVIRAVLCELERARWCYRYLSRLFHVGGDRFRAEKSTALVEAIADHLELLSGTRWLHQSICAGGVVRDLSIGDIGKTLDLCRWLKERSKEIMRNLNQEIFILHRWEEGLVIDEEFFEKIGVSGPIAQASGVAWDIRKLKPYFPYTRLAIETYRPDVNEVQDKKAGKHRHRFQSVYFQARQSLSLLEEILEELPGGGHRETARISGQWPRQDIAAVLESPTGSMRCSLSQGRITLSSFSTRLSPHLEELLTGLDCDDFPLAFYSLGYDFSQGALV